MKIVFVVFSMLFYIASPAKARRVVPKPNILWITTEDMSPELGCYGDPVAKTPNIDKLAAGGVRFTNVYSVHGACSPSRAALITGMYPTTIGAHHMRTITAGYGLDSIPDYEAIPPSYVKCFTEYLRAAGYYCSNNVKTDYQFNSPVTAWNESSTKAHWRNRPKDKPFFAVFNSMTTHASQIFERNNEPLLVDPAKVPLPPYLPDNPIIRKDMARNYTNIMLMDKEVGQIMKELEEDGLLENTIIFFFSDHGSGMFRAKKTIYDSGLRPPLIIRYPKKKFAGTVDDQMISFIDFAPSVLSLAGVKIPNYLPGRAFVGSQKSEGSGYIYAATDRIGESYDMIRAVRDKRFKYIRNYRPETPYKIPNKYSEQIAYTNELNRLYKENKLSDVQLLWFRKQKPLEELFDTQVDPYEVHDLAQDPAYEKDLERLRLKHEQWVIDTRDMGFIPEKVMVNQMFMPFGRKIITLPPVSQMSEVNNKPLIKLFCHTEGASIAYRVKGEKQWNLYTQPFAAQKGIIIEAKAIRIGYAPSTQEEIRL